MAANQQLSIYKFVKRARKVQARVTVDPRGPASLRLPSASISAANQAIEQLQSDKECTGTKRGSHLRFTDEEKAKIALYALQHGHVSAVSHFSTPTKKLSESTICTG